MNRVIVLEGPDGAGKTHAARQLEQHGWEYVHEGPPPADVDLMFYYASKMLHYLRKKKPVVVDRFHLGETIYGPTFRLKSRLSALEVALIDRILDAYGVETWLFLPPFMAVRENWMKKVKAGDPNDIIHKVDLLAKVYHLYENLPPKYLRWDYTTDGEFTADWAIARPKLPWGAIGSPYASLLIVGEQVNPNAHDLDLPFFSRDGASAYLSFALENAGYPEGSVAYANALKRNGKENNLVNVVACMQNFKLAVALGRTAEATCAAQGIPCYYLLHPSCAKRFKHYDLDKYSEELRYVRRLHAF